jgi:hypothetical protein
MYKSYRSWQVDCTTKIPFSTIQYFFGAYMKYFLHLFLIALSLNGASVVASEVTQCFEKAWGHPDNGGLGINRGGATKLCKGANNANEVIRCFEKAWIHPDNGGLGLNRGGAIELCQGTGNANEVTQCFKKAWAHPDNGGLGLTRGGAVELCAPSGK